MSLRASAHTGAPQGGLSCPSGNSPSGNPFSPMRSIVSAFADNISESIPYYFTSSGGKELYVTPGFILTPRIFAN